MIVLSDDKFGKDKKEKLWDYFCYWVFFNTKNVLGNGIKTGQQPNSKKRRRGFDAYFKTGFYREVLKTMWTLDLGLEMYCRVAEAGFQMLSVPFVSPRPCSPASWASSSSLLSSSAVPLPPCLGAAIIGNKGQVNTLHPWTQNGDLEQIVNVWHFFL